MDEIASSTLNEVVEAANDQYSNVIAAIARNPLQAVGIAAGVGFVLARLLRGKNRTPARAR
jgi:ElaB/YqjD/DUF883 family membrane-anchored ribosome-binding protein